MPSIFIYEGVGMNDLIIVKKFFEESKIDYYYGSLNGLRSMILNCYGEIVSKPSLKILPLIITNYSFIITERTEPDDSLVIFYKRPV